jgi:hypothetical protein
MPALIPVLLTPEQIAHIRKAHDDSRVQAESVLHSPGTLPFAADLAIRQRRAMDEAVVLAIDVATGNAPAWMEQAA